MRRLRTRERGRRGTSLQRHLRIDRELVQPETPPFQRRKAQPDPAAGGADWVTSLPGKKTVEAACPVALGSLCSRLATRHVPHLGGALDARRSEPSAVWTEG